jgi:hypothetical protein
MSANTASARRDEAFPDRSYVARGQQESLVKADAAVLHAKRIKPLLLRHSVQAG